MEPRPQNALIPKFEHARARAHARNSRAHAGFWVKRAGRGALTSSRTMIEARRTARQNVVATAVAVTAVVAALGASLATAAGAAGAPATRDASCRGADKPAADTPSKKLRKSIRCLINRERAVHGFGKLDHRRALQKAGQRHAKTMVATGCLAHRCPGEVDLEDRLRQAGYFNGASSWRFAENTGCAASAEAMVAGWMDVKFHRINILNKDFRDIGVGVVHKRIKSRCDEGFVTFAVVFGDRAL